MSRSRIEVGHVRLTADKPFEQFTAAFEQQLGRFEPDVYKEFEAGGDPAVVKSRLESMADPSGFMLFQTSNHGALLGIVGKPRKAMQYLLGNPLLAVEMTRHAIGAGLYAPLRVLIYEDEEGKTCVEYDRASSLFGQFGDERVDRLDRKVEDLTATAAR
jgi:uncharacterized protein (DUF302 family)